MRKQKHVYFYRLCRLRDGAGKVARAELASGRDRDKANASSLPPAAEQALLKSGKIRIWREMKMNRRRKKYHSGVTGLINAMWRSGQGGRVLALSVPLRRAPAQLLPAAASRALPRNPPLLTGDPLSPPLLQTLLAGAPHLTLPCAWAGRRALPCVCFGLGFALRGGGRAVPHPGSLWGHPPASTSLCPPQPKFNAVFGQRELSAGGSGKRRVGMGHRSHPPCPPSLRPASVAGTAPRTPASSRDAPMPPEPRGQGTLKDLVPPPSLLLARDKSPSQTSRRLSQGNPLASLPGCSSLPQ